MDEKTRRLGERMNGDFAPIVVAEPVRGRPIPPWTGDEKRTETRKEER